MLKAREDLRTKKTAFENGLITSSRVTAAERDVVSLQGRIEALNAQIRGDRAQVRSVEQRIRSRHQSAASIRLDLDGLKNTGEFASGLRSPVDGRVVEIKKRPGDSVTAGEVVAVVEPESAELEPVVYVTSTTGKQIHAGMDAQVSPSTVKREDYGFMTARVTSVGEYPVTPEAVRAAVANNALADEFIGTTAKIEIRARLAPGRRHAERLQVVIVHRPRLSHSERDARQGLGRGRPACADHARAADVEAHGRPLGNPPC